MTVNLQKGQKVDLTKGNTGLRNIMVGLGWDEAENRSAKGGIFGGLFSGKPAAIDCDATAFLCKNGKVNGKADVVYFGNLRHSTGSVIHQGDNLTGEGDGDDEQILVQLNNIPADYDKIVFVVNIYQARERKQDFGMIENAFIRIVDADTNKELLKYNLSENYDGMTAMIFGEVYRHENEWKFAAIGQATRDNSIGELLKMYS